MGDPAPGGNTELSTPSRWITRALFVVWGLLGLVLFGAPWWSAPRFPWGVTSFAAMTIGGWALGLAAIAWLAARVWRWGAVYGLLGVLWWFGAHQLAVVIRFRDSLITDAALAWPYLVAVGLTALAGMIGLVDVLVRRPSRELSGVKMPALLRAALVVFVAGVGLLSFVAYAYPDAGKSLRQFPEVLTDLTMWSFGGFFAALSLGALPVVFDRYATAAVWLTRGGLVLIIPILVAAATFWNVWDFSGNPRQIAYPLAYVVVGLASLFVLGWYRRARFTG